MLLLLIRDTCIFLQELHYISMLHHHLFHHHLYHQRSFVRLCITLLICMSLVQRLVENYSKHKK
nr:MAG TPA: hypothetical protein [Caudoviricetes sp.]